MPLGEAEYKRRLAAALALTRRTADSVDEELEGEPWGFLKEAASRAGRPSDKNAMPSKALSHALGEILGVGEAWFEAPNWWEVIAGATGPDAAGDPVADAKAEREELEKGLASRAQQFEPSESRTAKSGRGSQK